MNTQQLFLKVPSGERLFCFLQNARAGNTWALCCHGLFQDKCESWFLLSKLSVALMELGVSVCRYDARGCGDSTGSLSQLGVRDLYDDACSALDFVEHNYAPARTVVIGVGFGCVTACEIADARTLDSVVLVNPTFAPIFDYQQAFKPSAVVELLETKQLDMREGAIELAWLERLHESGSQYWNVLGQSVGLQLLQEISEVSLERVMEGNPSLRWFAIVSSCKEQCVARGAQLLQGGLNELQLVDSDPLFTHPKAQMEVVGRIRDWVATRVLTAPE